MRLAKDFEDSKANKRIDIKEVALSPTRWFLPKRLVAKEDCNAIYLFIYLFVNLCFT
jgi:hypothetical protein